MRQNNRILCSFSLMRTRRAPESGSGVITLTFTTATSGDSGTALSAFLRSGSTAAGVLGCGGITSGLAARFMASISSQPVRGMRATPAKGLLAIKATAISGGGLNKKVQGVDLVFTLVA